DEGRESQGGAQLLILDGEEAPRQAEEEHGGGHDRGEALPVDQDRGDGGAREEERRVPERLLPVLHPCAVRGEERRGEGQWERQDPGRNESGERCDGVADEEDGQEPQVL